MLNKINALGGNALELLCEEYSFRLLLVRSLAIPLGFTIFGEIFAYVTEVVTFQLHGWCMLGVFLLPAFTRLG